MEGLGNEWDWGAWCEIAKESIKNYVNIDKKNSSANIFLRSLSSIQITYKLPEVS